MRSADVIIFYIMNYLLLPFRITYKIYFLFCFVFFLILFYPAFKYYLSIPTRFPKAFIIMRFYAGLLSLLAFVRIKTDGINNIPASGTCSAVSATTTLTINTSDNASFTYTSATYCQSGTAQTPAITGLPGGTFSSTPSGLSINPGVTPDYAERICKIFNEV